MNTPTLFLTFLRKHRVTLLIVAVVLIAAAPTLLYPMGRDQGMYANIAASILRGGTPYTDMWDIKPPPIYYLYALGMSLFGQTPVGIRAIDLLLVPLGLLGLVRIGTLLGNSRVGQWAALLYGVFYFSDQFTNLTQSDSLVTVFIIAAAVCVLQSQQYPVGTRKALLWSLSAGAWCGFIVWFKQYQLFFIGALILYQVWHRRGHWLALSREALSFVVGGLLTGGGLLAYFAAIGVFNELLIVAQSTSAYNAQYTDWGAFLSQIGSYFAFRWAIWSPVFTLTVVAFVLALLRRFRGKWLLAWLWLIAGIAFMMIQRLGFDTHWIPMLPALSLLSGAALDALLIPFTSENKPLPLARNERMGAGVGVGGSKSETFIEFGMSKSNPPSPTLPPQGGKGEKPLPLARNERMGAGVGVGAVFAACFIAILAYNTWLPALPYLLEREDQVAYYARFQANDLKPEQGLQVVNYLRERVAVGDTIYIWGFRPEIAFMGGWRPATRWQAQFPLVATWYPHEWQQQNVDILWAALPPYALIVRDDYMPWVTGRSDDSYTILQDYTELNNWFIANYDIVATLGDFLICQRKPRT